MRVYIMRHGETIWNKERRLQGQSGADLTETGVLLAEMTAEALKDVPFDLCYSSPLTRARHTAEIMLRGRNIPLIFDDRIQEIGFGIWEGKSIMPDKAEIDLDEFKDFHDDPYNYQPPKGGESIQDVINRAEDFWHDIIKKPDNKDRTILVSTHGCCSRALLHYVYEDKNDYWHSGVPMNCAVSIVDVKDGKAVLTAEDQVYYPKKYYSNFYPSFDK
ncbi:MAG: histidine phosphatase family protein [Eubacterium sp.]|nr:histidine phosphatase family protein [Eubacterium sp.]